MTAALTTALSTGYGRLKNHFANWRQWELNPIVLKELRQAVRSMAVLGMLHLFLVVLFVTAIIMLATSSFDEGGSPRLGSDIFQAFLIILAGASVMFIPLYVGIRLAVERPTGNLDLLYISTLSPGRIIRGKFYCGVYMTALFFSACMPFMAFTNLLRGVDLPSMFAVLMFLFMVVCMMNMVAIFLACLPVSVPFKVLLALYGVFQGLMLVFPIVFYSFELMRSGVGAMMGGRSFWMMFGTWFSMGLGGALLLYFLAVALISPPSSNRALPLRIYLTGLWLVGAVMSLIWVVHRGDADLIQPWAFQSYLMLAAALLVVVSGQDELSLRVRRDIPRPGRKRWLAFLFYNGTPGGLVWVGTLFTLTWLATFGVMAMFGADSLRLFSPGSDNEFFENSTVTVFYAWDYALLGLFLHRRFLSRRSPKFAGLLAIVLASLWAIVPNLVLFFVNRLTWQSAERMQLGNIFNVYIMKDQYSRFGHLVFSVAVLVVLLFLNAKWFKTQAAKFVPLDTIVPAPVLPPPIPTSLAA